MNEKDDEIEILNEPPEQPSMSSLWRNVYSLLLNYSTFINNSDDLHWLEMQATGRYNTR